MHELKERTLHHKERARLRRELEEVANHFALQKPDILIVLDRSARPFALPMKEILSEAFGIKVKVFFIHPEQLALRYRSKVLPGKWEWEKLIKLVEKEHPALVKAVQGKRVVILDDQHNTRWTLEAVERTIMAMGATHARGRAVSIYDALAKNVYSWRRNDLHAVEKPVAAGRLFVTKRKQLNDLEKQELATLRKRMRERVTPRVIQRIKLKRAGK